MAQKSSGFGWPWQHSVQVAELRNHHGQQQLALAPCIATSTMVELTGSGAGINMAAA
jgi:hypothetical protein